MTVQPVPPSTRNSFPAISVDQSIDSTPPLRSVAFVIAAIAAILLFSGCGTPEPEESNDDCEPGTTAVCECPSDESGTRLCDDDGTFGACDCPDNDPTDNDPTDNDDNDPTDNDDNDPTDNDDNDPTDNDDNDPTDNDDNDPTDNDDPSNGCGISAEHPGDENIEDHPAVIFTEDFEHQSKSVFDERYTDVRRPENMEFVNDVADVSPGDVALQMETVGGEDTGSDLYRNLDELDGETYDELYVRYYVKYVHGHSYHHAGVRLGGYNPPTDWPQGGAGTRPDGDDRFKVRAQPMGDDHQFDLYTYWMHMRGNPGDDNYWGNTFLGDVDLQVPDQEWFAVELHVAVNNPVDTHNGEMTLWIDGEEIIHLAEGTPHGEWIWDTFHPGDDGEPFEGFQWRNDAALDLSFLWLHHYVTQHEDGETSRMWFNDVVLATDYIGPIDGVPCPE